MYNYGNKGYDDAHGVEDNEYDCDDHYSDNDNADNDNDDNDAVAMTFRFFDFPYYNEVIMSTMASQFTSLTIVYSTVYSRADERKRQSPASLAFVMGIHRWPMNFSHKGSVTREMFPFDDVTMW